MKTSLIYKMIGIGTFGLLVLSLWVQNSFAATDDTFAGSFAEVKKFATTAGVNVPASAKDLIISILNIILTLTAVIALGALVYAAFLMIAHLGEEEDVKKAKNIIKYAIIGLILIGLSAIIVNVVINIIILGKPDV